MAFSDNFNRADGTVGTTNYDTVTGFNLCNIFSNGFRGNGDLSMALVKTSAEDFGDDQETQFTVVSVGTGDIIGMVVRGSTAGTGYLFWLDGVAEASRGIYRFASAASMTKISGSTQIIDAVAGDVVRFRAEGNTLTVYVNGVAVATATDSTYTTGQPGIWYARSNINASRADDFSAQSLSSTTPVGRDLTSTARVRNAIGRSATSTANVRGTSTRSVTHTANVRATATRSITSAANVRNASGRSGTFESSVRDLAGRDAQLDANVRAAAGQSAQATANIRNVVGRDLGVAADVEGVAGTVGRSIEFAASIRTTAGQEAELAASVRATVTRSGTVAANVRAASGRDLTVGGGVRGPAGRSVTASSDIRGTVQRTGSFSASLRELTGRSLGTSANVRMLVGRTIELRARLGDAPEIPRPGTITLTLLERTATAEALTRDTSITVLERGLTIGVE